MVSHPLGGKCSGGSAAAMGLWPVTVVAGPVAIAAGGGDAARRLWPVMVSQGLWPSTTHSEKEEILMENCQQV